MRSAIFLSTLLAYSAYTVEPGLSAEVASMPLLMFFVMDIIELFK